MKIMKHKITAGNLMAILWTCMVTILFFLFYKYGYISFEQNDDMFISTIPSGIYGQHYIFTSYSNVLQGIFLAGLSKLMPVCNWTMILYVGYVYISYIGIGIWLIKTKGAWIGVCLSSLFFFTTYQSLLHYMNYSKTGGVLMSVGLVLFAHCAGEIRETKNTVFLLIFGSMIFVGSLVRRDSIIAALPFIMLLIIDTVLRCKNRAIRIIKTSLPWLVLILCIGTAWLADSILYKVNDGWRNYKEFNSVRTNLDDWGILDYETHREIYQEIGYDENDVKLLSTWHSADSEVYSIENLQEIIRNKTKKEYSLANIKQSMEETYENVIKNNYMFSVIAVLTLACGLINWKKLFLLIPNFLLLFLELLYLVFNGRYPERATLLVFMYAFAVIIYAFVGQKELKKKQNGFMAAMLLIIVVGGLYHSGICKITEENHMKEYPYKEEYREFLHTISENQDNLYVWDIFAIECVLEGAYTPYEAFDFGVLSNSVYTGGWFINTPIMSNNAERFGEKNNPYKLLAHSQNVFLVTLAGMDINDTLSYIRRHYNEDAQSRCIAELNEIVVYSFAEE